MHSHVYDIPLNIIASMERALEQKNPHTIANIIFRFPTFDLMIALSEFDKNSILN